MSNWDNWRLITVLSIAGFVGLLFDRMLVVMLITLFCYTVWLEHSWQQLYRWLKNPKKHKAPHADGAIDEVCREIEQVRKKNRSRKKKLSGHLKHFQATTAALPYGIVVLEKDGRILWTNSSAQQLLGIYWPRDSHVRIKNLIREPQFQDQFNLKPSEWQDVVVTSPVDPNLQLEIKLVNYLDDGRLLIARNITPTLKLQTMRRDFVANVSHELRTPLTVLRGYLEVMDQASPSEQWAEALPVMRQQAQRMNTMITELLALSQLETGEKELEHHPVDIARLLNSVINDAKKLDHYQEQDIQLDRIDDEQLLADEKELRSAVSNLIFNAVKYTTAKSIITLQWQVDKYGGSIRVRDNGDGIAPEHIDRLTERFYRVDSGRSQDLGGTGLGLAIVKHVLQRHNATLKISSELGEGSQFSCCFSESQIIRP